MAIYVNHSYRIKRNFDYEADMKFVVDLKICQSMAELLVLCAIIGYNNKAYVPFEKGSSDGGVLMQFFRERNYDFIDLLAYAYKKEQNITRTNEKYTIFESFANGGFPILVKCLGIDLVERDKNNRSEILKRYYSLVLSNGFKM